MKGQEEDFVSSDIGEDEALQKNDFPMSAEELSAFKASEEIALNKAKSMIADKLATYYTPEAVSQRLKDRLLEDPLETRISLREVFVLVQDILGAAGESALRNTLERHGVL